MQHKARRLKVEDLAYFMAKRRLCFATTLAREVVLFDRHIVGAALYGRRDVPAFVVAADVPAHLGDGAFIFVVIIIFVVFLLVVESFQNLLGGGIFVCCLFQEQLKLRRADTFTFFAILLREEFMVVQL